MKKEVGWCVIKKGWSDDFIKEKKGDHDAKDDFIKKEKRMMHYKKEKIMMYCIIKNDVYISDIRKRMMCI